MGTQTRCQPAGGWAFVDIGAASVGVAERDALGTSARVAAWPAFQLARVLAIVDAELTRLDMQASRFREDSEISAIHRSPDEVHVISDGLAEAIAVALAAARWTGGLVDPTVGGALQALGYDRDFAAVPRDGGPPVVRAGAGPAPGQVIRLTAGALATSSIVSRQWHRGGRRLHHIVDPRTGLPAAGPWRTVSVAAANCAEANAASTAAIIAGDQAEPWLADLGLPSRLVARNGSVRLLAGWPPAEGGTVEPPAACRMPAGPGAIAVAPAIGRGTAHPGRRQAR